MYKLAAADCKKYMCELLHSINSVFAHREHEDINYVFLNWCASSCFLYAEKFPVLFIRNYFLQCNRCIHVYITGITNTTLLLPFDILLYHFKPKYTCVTSPNRTKNNQRCLVMFVRYQLTKNFKNWRSPFSTRKPRRSKIPSIFSAPEGSLLIAFSTK